MKYLALLCLLFLLPRFASAQKWAELNDSLIHYYTRADYKKAIPFAEKTITAAKSELGESNINYPHSITYLGVIYSNTGETNKAEILFLQACELYRKISGETHENYIISLNSLAGLYQSIGSYEKAEPLLLQVSAIRKNTLGESHADYANSLQNLAAVYTSMGKYEKAELFYLETLAIRRKVLGENSPDYTYTLNGLAGLYRRIGNYGKAESFYFESIAIQKKILGEEHQVYANSLNDVAELYTSMGNYEKAEQFLNQAAAITKKAMGEDHPYYATTLNNQAGLYLNLGNYEKAEQLYLQSTAIIKKVLGENHTNYAGSLQNLALLYTYTDNYEKAEQYFIQAAAIRKRLQGETDPEYATLLHNLAVLYQNMGNYERAEQLLIQAITIKKKLYGDKHPDYAGSLNSLGALYASMGKYGKAELLFIQATAIWKSALGEIHPDYSTSLSNLALLYESSGNYQKAEELFIQSATITKKGLGEDHPDYAISLNNLALLYTNTGEYEKAEQLFIQSAAITKKVRGEKSTAYARNLNNLARLYERMGAYQKAEPIHIQAGEIFKTLLGEDHPFYPISLNNLAVLYKNMGKYEKAEPLFIKATAIRKKVLGGDHPDYATSLTNEAELYESMGNYEKAELLLTESNKIKIKNLFNIFNTLSEKEKGNYLANNVSLNNANNSFLYNNPNASRSFLQGNYDLQLLLKSLSLIDTKNLLDAIRKSKDTSINKLLVQWQNDKINLSKQYALPVAARHTDLKELEARTEDLEKELNRKSSEFRKQQQALRISTGDVQKNLEEGEVAIEFVRFQLYNKKLTDSIMYGAYILKKNSAYPFFVSLCVEKQLQLLFDSAGNTATKMVSSLYRGLEGKSSAVASLGEALYKLVWQPLEPYLKEIKKISYSPAGKLYSIAFHALPVDSNTLLIDKYQLQQYTSTREVALRNTRDQITRPTTITLFGDARFTMDSLQLAKLKSDKSEKENLSIYTVPNRSISDNSWDSLPGTAQEIDKIKKIFAQHKISPKVFVQVAANEENLKALDNNSPQVLHIATHGFFLPALDERKVQNELEKQNTYTLAKDPLLRSGLIFSGGNYAWSGKTPVQGVEDGIATAYEISQLNLSNTELVVLSACETALGDIKGSEGVFGLQRSFKMAGVKKMIVSLWQVPDKETAELMTGFYNYWLGGKKVNDAFNQAQTDMRKKYAPFYWAAFVLIE